MNWLLLLVGGWLAATISGAAGFGGALLLLPVLTWVVGPKAAVPVLTLAQLLGNLSRAGFGWREIKWRPVLLFSAGAVLASLLGARLFVELAAPVVQRAIGTFLLLIVAFRHTRMGKGLVLPERLLAPSGAVVGLLSAIAGSAGPLGAVVFLGLNLSPSAYVASEAVSASLMHLTKSLVYGRYALLTAANLLQGLALGAAMVLGSWTGRKLLTRLSERGFGLLIEVLLIVAAVALLVQ